MGHLNMIQGVITRMSTFSAAAKTFTVTVLAGLAAISLQADAFSLGMIGLIATILFLATDLYYLKLEIRFRSLYEHVSTRPLVEADDLAIKPKTNVDDMNHAFMSPTILFYIAMVLAAFIFSGVGLLNDSFSGRLSKSDTARIKHPDPDPDTTLATKRAWQPVLGAAPSGGANGFGQRIPGPTKVERIERTGVRGATSSGVPIGDR